MRKFFEKVSPLFLVKIVKICKILGKNCQNLHKFLEKMSKFVQIWGKIAKICTILGKKYQK